VYLTYNSNQIGLKFPLSKSFEIYTKGQEPIEEAQDQFWTVLLFLFWSNSLVFFSSKWGASTFIHFCTSKLKYFYTQGICLLSNITCWKDLAFTEVVRKKRQHIWYLALCHVQITQKYCASYQLKQLVSGVNLIKIITLNML
jgi:hypothetical protein